MTPDGSFAENVDELRAAEALAGRMIDVVAHAGTVGIGLEALMNVVSSYLLVTGDFAGETAEALTAVLDEFHQITKARIIRDLPPKAVH